MDIRITGRRYELSDELRRYAGKKIDRVLKHFDGVHHVEMTFSVEGGTPKVGVVVGTVRGKRCVAEETHEDVFAAVDRVVDKIDRQITKLKDKLRKHHGREVEATGSSPE